MAEISWIKLKTTMFDDEKIRLIQSMPEADAILVIWIRLLVLAGKTNDDGLIYIQRNMPYTDEMLATLFGKPLTVIRLALQTLEQFEMVDLNENGMLAITNWEKHQNIEGMDKVRKLNAERNKKYRERKKQLMLEDDVSVTSRDATDLDLDKDLDKDKDNKEESKKSLCKYSDEHLRLSEKFKFNLINDFPKEMAKVDVNKWADVFRLMEERDSITIEQIEYVIDWLPSNSFWATNIRSPKKLREQYERLVVEIKNSVNKGKSKGYSQSSRKETLPDWADKEIVETPVSEDEKAAFEQQLRKLGVQKE